MHNGEIKISDFGWSNFHNDIRNTYCGTPDYLSPEMILGKNHDSSIDIWEIGILMYELLHGKPPFSPEKTLKDHRKLRKIIENNVLKGNIRFGEISAEA